MLAEESLLQCVDVAYRLVLAEGVPSAFQSTSHFVAASAVSKSPSMGSAILELR